MRRYKEALAAFERAMQLNANEPLFRTNKAFALIKLKRNTEALIACERALACNPSHLGAWTYKAYALQNLKRYAEALAANERAISLEPYYYKHLWVGKAVVLSRLWRFKQVWVTFNQAVDLALNSDPHETR
jgi:superkiller protein 3